MDTQESGADVVGGEAGGGLSYAGGHHHNNEHPPVQLQWEDLPTNIWGPNRTEGDMACARVVMNSWDIAWMRKMEMNNVVVDLGLMYMDVLGQPEGGLEVA